MTPAVLLPAVHLALSAAYAGFQWTVRGLVYPQFAEVPAASFAVYERRHQQRVSLVVGPLFAGQALTTGWLLVNRPAATPLPAVLVGAAAFVTVLAVTGLVAVPLHRTLGQGWDGAAFRRLLRADTVRAVAASIGAAAAVWSVVG